MLHQQDRDNIQLMIHRAEPFEHESMRDYALMELGMFNHQRKKRALTPKENIACEYATELLAQLDSLATQRKQLSLMRYPGIIKQLYIYRH